MGALVSVIIPAYNAGKYIVASVNSVLEQTYSNVEVVVVNDGSQDNTEVLCAALARQHANVVLVNQENQGVSVARNVGMKTATGDYFIFLDADDTMPPHSVEALLAAAEQSNADMTMGKISPDEEIPIDTFVGEEFLLHCLMDGPLSRYSVRTLYKRAFVRDIAFEKGFVCSEDGYFIFLCACKLPKVVTIEECVYFYTVNLASVSRSAFTHRRYDSISGLLEKKEAVMQERFPQHIALFYHAKTKTLMMLLGALAHTKGRAFRKQEDETWARFESVKEYFQADLPYSNADFYRMLVKQGYRRYKRLLQLKIKVKRLLTAKR